MALHCGAWWSAVGRFCLILIWVKWKDIACFWDFKGLFSDYHSEVVCHQSRVKLVIAICLMLIWIKKANIWDYKGLWFWNSTSKCSDIFWQTLQGAAYQLWQVIVFTIVSVIISLLNTSHSSTRSQKRIENSDVSQHFSLHFRELIPDSAK